MTAEMVNLGVSKNLETVYICTLHRTLPTYAQVYEPTDRVNIFQKYQCFGAVCYISI